MKAQMLKIAGVKSEKEFYKKFPDEASFMKAHGKEFKKAMRGSKVEKAQFGDVAPSRPTVDDASIDRPVDYSYLFEDPADAEARKAAERDAAILGRSTTGQNWDVTNPTGQNLTDMRAAQAKLDKKAAFQKKIPSYIKAGSDILRGATMIKQQKRQRREAQQMAKLTGVQAAAAASMPIEPINRQYVRPEDNIIQQDQLFPSQGVGTNVLAEYGATIGGNPTEIMNTFAPNTIYSDMGYEPLSDSDRVKQYQQGGQLYGMMNDSKFGDFMNQGGDQLLGQLSTAITGEEDAGTAIGAGIGTALLGEKGRIPGSLVGDLIDTNERKTRKAKREIRKNLASLMGTQAGMGIQNMFSANLKDGGEVSDYQWVSHTWQPQVITQFGEHKLTDLLRPPKDADMLRAGGEIRNLRDNFISDDERLLTNMALGGQLKTTWGGYAEPISQNPYLPGTGQTVMFRGQSHDESDGKGRTGIGVKYGKHDSYTDYAEYGTEADADVEVERNEPAVELPDTKSSFGMNDEFAGGGQSTNQNLSMNVFGNLVISDLVSPEYAGKKYKSVVKDLSEQTTKSNKKIERASEKLVDLNPQSAYDMTKFNSLKATIYGENMKLKKIATDIQDLAAGQTAYNDTAEEFGLDADSLAKGKVKQAKKGANVPKAQAGTLAGRRGRAELANVNPVIKGLLDLLSKKNYDINVTSGYREGSSTAQGRPSRHSKGEAVDVTFPTLSSGAYDAILNDPEVSQYLLQNGITAINEYDPAAQKATGATGPHIHFGFDKGTALADKFRKEAAAKYPGALTPISQTGLPKVSPDNFKYLQDLYSAAQKEGRGPAVLKFQQEFHRLAPEYAKGVLSKYPTTAYGKQKGLEVSDLNQNLDSIFGKRTQQYMAALTDGVKDDTPTGDLAKLKEMEELILPPSKKTDKKTTTNVAVTPYKRSLLLDAANSLLPYIRPSDVEELDPRQLIGEMYALSTNQLEPVQAQKIQPRLSTPIDISLQDILNENRATLRRQQQLVGYNPSAQSAFAAQEYGMNQRVLGEQFRLNQAERNRVYEKNRDILNQSDLTNLGILSSQADKQALAISNTKDINREALSSIASKVAENKLENRTLAVMENMYNYRYDPSFRAQNYQLAQWNIPGDTASRGAKTTEIPVYGPDGKTILYYKTSDSELPSTATPPINAKNGTSKKRRKDALNGSVVKALKNL
jgi:hypothetical protein